jgi:uncharacterized membrane protein YobD (UPF0266 family)
MQQQEQRCCCCVIIVVIVVVVVVVAVFKHGPIPNQHFCALRIIAAFAAFSRIDSAH